MKRFHPIKFILSITSYIYPLQLLLLSLEAYRTLLGTTNYLEIFHTAAFLTAPVVPHHSLTANYRYRLMLQRIKTGSGGSPNRAKLDARYETLKHSSFQQD
jgi:hypothetical protein